jgi:hypothetical protein
MLAVAGALVVLPAVHDATDRARATSPEDLYLSGSSVDVTADVHGDLVAAGSRVYVRAPVDGLAILAGGEVTVDAPTGGDVLAAGGEVSLRGAASDDVRLAGGNVRISATVGDDVIAAGGTVRVEPSAVVGGRAWLTGGDVVVGGIIARELRVAGGRVSIEGTVRGDVEVRAGALEIGPAGRIEGDVLYTGPREAQLAPGARVDGRMEYRPQAQAGGARAFAVFVTAWAVAGLFATGAAMLLLFPQFTHAAATRVRTEPWRSLGAGTVAVLGGPALVLTLLVTVIGIPLGLILLVGYLLAALLGYLVSAVFVAELGLRRAARPARPTRGALVLGLLVALLVLGIVQLIPLLGFLVWLAAVFFGTGALLLQLHRVYRDTAGGALGPPQPAPEKAG